MATDVTFHLDEQTLDRIRQLAADQQISVSAWIGDLVTRTVAELDGFELARRQAVRAMKRPVPVQEGPLTREQAHEC